MIPLVNRRHDYVFYYNPKSACTSYRKFFVELHANELKPDQRKQGAQAAAHWKPKPKIAKPYNQFFAFTVVRNPFDRLVSAYVDKCFQWKYPAEQRYQAPRIIETIHKPVFEFLGRPMDLEKGFSFRELLTFLEANLHKGGINPHFRAQAKARIKLDAYHRIEDPLDSLHRIYEFVFRDKPKMLKRYRRKAKELERQPNRRVNRSIPSKEYQDHSEPFADFNFRDFEDLKNKQLKPAYSSFYDDELVAKMNQVFALDFFRYQYNRTPS